MRRPITGAMLAGGVSYAIFEAYRKWYFPRDPARTVPQNAKVVAPADGRVVYLEQVDGGVVPISIKGRTEIPLEEIVKGAERLPRARWSASSCRPTTSTTSAARSPAP